MESQIDYWTARALLEWQVELGATEALLDAPIDRYALEAASPKKAASPVSAPVRQKAPEVDAVQVAKTAAKRALQNGLAGDRNRLLYRQQLISDIVETVGTAYLA